MSEKTSKDLADIKSILEKQKARIYSIRMDGSADTIDFQLSHATICLGDAIYSLGLALDSISEC